jgi:hypothetical protein
MHKEEINKRLAEIQKLSSYEQRTKARLELISEMEEN